MADIKNVNNMKEAHLGPSIARIKTDIIAYVRRTSRSLAPWEMLGEGKQSRKQHLATRERGERRNV